MTNRLTDEEVGILYRHAEGERKQIWEKELRSRARAELIRKLPNRTGRCPHGHKIKWDDRGAMASGYPIHVDSQGRYMPGYCDQWDGIVNDPDTPEVAAIKALIETLR